LDSYAALDRYYSGNGLMSVSGAESQTVLVQPETNEKRLQNPVSWRRKS